MWTQHSISTVLAPSLELIKGKYMKQAVYADSSRNQIASKKHPEVNSNSLETQAPYSEAGQNCLYQGHSYLWYDKVKMNIDFQNHFVRCAILKVWNIYKLRLIPKISLCLFAQGIFLEDK